jgi:hypothetical protein
MQVAGKRPLCPSQADTLGACCACLLSAICRHLGNRPHAVKDHRELLHCRGTFVLSLHPKIAL